jgi:hypothetical protein
VAEGNEAFQNGTWAAAGYQCRNASEKVLIFPLQLLHHPFRLCFGGIFEMQPGPNPEDINTILSRFQSWAEKHPSEGNGNGNGHKNGAGSDSDEIREIPYEEAIRQYRSRHGQTPRRAAAAKPRIRAGSAQKPAMQTEKPLMKKEPNPPAVEMEAEALPQWVSELPLVADSEPVIELRAAVQPAPVVAEQVVQARTQVAIDLEEATEVVQRAMEGVRKKRNTTPPKTKPEPEKLAAMAAKAETPARASVAPARAATVASPTPVAKPERKAPQKPSQARSAATRPPQARLAPTPPIPAIRKAASAGQPVKAQARMARPNPKSSIIKAQIKTAAQPPAPRIARAAVKSPAPRAAGRRSAPTPHPTLRRPQHAPFHKVLANTVHRAKISAVAKKKKLAPDRTQRITTRFTAAEERRIEKLAAEADLTVSAYLRECALAVVASQNSLALPSFATTKARKSNAPPPVEYQPNAYSVPAPSLLGGWLSLLRNRFLGPPVRFSEQG